MTQAHELLSIADLDAALERAQADVPTLFFKHSSTCDISAAAWEEFLDFLRDNSTPVQSYFLVVQNSRDVSQEIARRLNIRHESPQAILLRKGAPVWHDSHRRLTTQAFRSVVAQYAAESPA
jgi:bacillithiol system protein YtxJ